MKAVLEISENDLNIQLVDVINSLFQHNFSEITIKKSNVTLEEFDASQNLEEIIFSLKENGHNELLVNEIEEGFKNSSIFNK